MALNAGALILFNKVVAPYVVADWDSDTIKMLKAAGLITGHRRVENFFGPFRILP